MTEKATLPPDHEARAQALDTRFSYLVQAPAGSGKTELLTHRFLKLLAEVNEPEEILAITFTRAATAEMRARVLGKLEDARRHPVAEPGEGAVMADARAALAHAELRGWNLLEQPHRLDIQTIDSLCLRIAQEQPLLARMGGHLDPQDDARPLYDLAAHRTLANLGSGSQELDVALKHLLARRDNNLADCERLISEMLARRDQWLHAFPAPGQLTEDDWDRARLQMEQPFKQTIRRGLQQAYKLLMSQPVLVDQLMKLAQYACSNENTSDLRLLATLKSLPATNEGFLEHWKCLCNFLLTVAGEWRARVDKNLGFPPGKAGTLEAHRKEAMTDMIHRLRRIEGLLSALAGIRNLPPARYEEPQWLFLRHLFIILRHAVAELRVLFAERNLVDFTELGNAALQVLGAEHPTERSLIVSERIRHLLVDEFQDTSRRQHRLLQTLLRAWNTGDGRTCFLVGDPMQSIYMFRQAEVELFEQVKKHGITSSDQQHACTPLQLSANFRSHAGLTEPLNEHFQIIFSGDAVEGAAAVSFSRSEAVTEASTSPSVCLHPQFLQVSGRSKPEREDCEAAQRQEAHEVIEIIRKHWPHIERATNDPKESFTIAVLARARQHLALIAQKLREDDIPFRAIELETLAERQEIRDLLSLTRALLHPMDRIAWLSILRAPWCGLQLRDLQILCGEDNKDFHSIPVRQLMEERVGLLSEDGQKRLARISVTLKQAIENRYRNAQASSIAPWIERCWHSLGGPLCVDEQQRENARIFFSMLDEITIDGIACLGNDLDVMLDRLFAQPDPRASERAGVQLMTIHKAKGLGFDVVIVPGLDRNTGRDSQALIAMLERVSPGNKTRDELLIAPIGGKGEGTHPLYRWVNKQRDLRESEERKRVFYVACTRARRELHLMASVVATGSEIRPAESSSLLASAWPALKAGFNEAWTSKPRQNIIPFPDFSQPGIVDIAAVAESPLRGIRRLPVDSALVPSVENVTVPGTFNVVRGEEQAVDRPQGGRLQRVTGSIIHAVLEQASRMLAARPSLAGAEIASLLQPFIERQLLMTMVEPGERLNILAAIQTAVKHTASDADGMWIVSPHPDAQSEISWTGWVDGALQTFRADRIFRAGATPQSGGSEYFWVVDYKTSGYAVQDTDAFFESEQTRYELQLDRYGRALRLMLGPDLPLRFGLYFPMLGRLKYWEG